MKKIVILLCLFLLALVGCEETVTNGPQLRVMSSDKLEELVPEGEYLILDVRTKEEYSISHIEGALNMPYDEIDDTFDFSPYTKIFVYCQSGKRSKLAATTLKGLGLDVIDLGAYDSIPLEKE